MCVCMAHGGQGMGWRKWNGVAGEVWRMCGAGYGLAGEGNNTLPFIIPHMDSVG